MKTNREKSIEILKEAIKNKTLGVYKGAEDCVYYDSKTESCCAIGALIPRDELFKHVDVDSGNVKSLFGGNEGKSIRALVGKGWVNNTGLTDNELFLIQQYHDTAIFEPLKIGSFERYVSGLK